MPKHPDHVNAFCQCFGPCPLCDAEELEKRHANPVKIEFKTFEAPGLGYFNIESLRKLATYGNPLDLGSESMKDTTIGPVLDAHFDAPITQKEEE
jgi:hypothetical protein